MGRVFSDTHSNVVSLSDARQRLAPSRPSLAETGTAEPAETCPTKKETVFFVTGGQFQCMVNNTEGALRAGDFLRVPEGAPYSFNDIGAMSGAMVSHRFPAGVPGGLLREIGTALPPFVQAFPRHGSAAFARLEAIARRWGIKLDSDAAA